MESPAARPLPAAQSERGLILPPDLESARHQAIAMESARRQAVTPASPGREQPAVGAAQRSDRAAVQDEAEADRTRRHYRQATLREQEQAATEAQRLAERGLAARSQAEQRAAAERARIRREEERDLERHFGYAAREQHRVAAHQERQARDAARERERERLAMNRRTIDGLRQQDREAGEAERQQHRIESGVERASVRFLRGTRGVFRGALGIAEGAAYVGLSDEESTQRLLQGVLRVRGAVMVMADTVQVFHGLSRAIGAIQTVSAASAAAETALAGARARTVSATAAAAAAEAAGARATVAAGGIAGSAARVGGVGLGGIGTAGLPMVAGLSVAALASATAAITALSQTIRDTSKYGFMGGSQVGSFSDKSGDLLSRGLTWLYRKTSAPRTRSGEEAEIPEPPADEFMADPIGVVGRARSQQRQERFEREQGLRQRQAEQQRLRDELAVEKARELEDVRRQAANEAWRGRLIRGGYQPSAPADYAGASGAAAQAALGVRLATEQQETAERRYREFQQQPRETVRQPGTWDWLAPRVPMMHGDNRPGRLMGPTSGAGRGVTAEGTTAVGAELAREREEAGREVGKQREIASQAERENKRARYQLELRRLEAFGQHTLGMVSGVVARGRATELEQRVEQFQGPAEERERLRKQAMDARQAANEATAKENEAAKHRLEIERQVSAEKIKGAQDAVKVTEHEIALHKQIIAEHRGRLQGAQERLGQLNPIEQRVAIDLAREISRTGGAGLSEERWQQAEQLGLLGYGKVARLRSQTRFVLGEVAAGAIRGFGLAEDEEEDIRRREEKLKGGEEYQLGKGFSKTGGLDVTLRDQRKLVVDLTADADKMADSIQKMMQPLMEDYWKRVEKSLLEKYNIKTKELQQQIDAAKQNDKVGATNRASLFTRAMV